MSVKLLYCNRLRWSIGCLSDQLRRGALYASDMIRAVRNPCAVDNQRGQIQLFSPNQIDRAEPANMGALRGLMNEKKKKKESDKPKKMYWHLYSLQMLGPEKFSRVVDRILRKDFGLIK